jgi:polar amino acid transport system substrate-binding protein
MKPFVLAVAGLLAICACGGSSGPSAPSQLAKVDRIANEVPAAVRALAPLQIASDATYEPNEFVDPTTGAISGWDVDFGLAVCKVMGIECKFQNVSFDTIIAQLKATNPKYQFSVSSWSPTEDRENGGIDFISYYKAGESWIVKSSGGPTIDNAVDMCGKNVAVESGTTEESDAWAFMGQGVGGAPIAGKTNGCQAAGKGNIKVLSFEKQTEANSALLSGRADVGWNDSPVASYQVKQSGGKFKLAGKPCSVSAYGIALVKGSPLEPPITDAVKYLIDNGFYTSILQKWGVTDGAIKSSDVKLNDNSAIGPVCVP